MASRYLSANTSMTNFILVLRYLIQKFAGSYVEFKIHQKEVDMIMITAKRDLRQPVKQKLLES